MEPLRIPKPTIDHSPPHEPTRRELLEFERQLEVLQFESATPRRSLLRKLGSKIGELLEKSGQEFVDVESDEVIIPPF